MSSLFSSALFLLILLTLNPILSSHIRAGCLSWKLKLSQRDKRKEIEEAEDRSPDWCRDSLLSLRLEKEGQAQKGPHPFVIRTQSFKMSNAIRGTENRVSHFKLIIPHSILLLCLPLTSPSQMSERDRSLLFRSFNPS